MTNDHEIRLLLDLLNIEGLPGEETHVAGFVCERLTAAGLPAERMVHDDANTRSPRAGDIGNLVAKLPGRGKLAELPPILMSAHLDTVPLCRGARPILDPTARRIHTDGSTALGGDNRTGCAAILNAALTVLQGAMDYRPVTLLFFVQEEIGLRGSRYLERTLLGDVAFGVNVDGGAPQDLWIGAVGAANWEVTIHGVPAHAGVHPEDGVSAVTIAALALAALHQGGWHGKVERDGRTGTCNVGTVYGGEATNVVTDLVKVVGEARSHDAAFLENILQAIEASFAVAVEEVTNASGERGRAEFASEARYGAFSLRAESPAVTTTSAVLRELGLEPVLDRSDGGLDANNLNAIHGVETVTTGAGAHNLHTVNEYVDLDEFMAGCELMLRLATRAG
jgi:tripeptide aminopeptidase